MRFNAQVMGIPIFTDFLNAKNQTEHNQSKQMRIKCETIHLNLNFLCVQTEKVVSPVIKTFQAENMLFFICFISILFLYSHSTNLKQ